MFGELYLKTKVKINDIDHILEITNMENGIITGVKINNRLFNYQSGLIKSEINDSKIFKTKKEKKISNKLFIITTRNKTPIYKDIIDEINNLNDDINIIPFDKIKKIIKKHLPHIKSSTCRNYSHQHRLYIKEQKNKSKNDVNKLINKAPDNTMLFLNWLNEAKPKSFSINDFLVKFKYITRQQAEKIINHQIKIGNIIQIDSNKFTTPEQLKKQSHGRFN